MEQMELVQPLFLHEQIQKRYTLKRFNSNGVRYYFDLEKEQIVLYPSVTSVISEEFPKDQWLINWMVQQGENYKVVRDTKAQYGTAMHHLIADAITKQEFNYNYNYLHDKIFDLKLNYFTEFWIPDLQKDLAAFAKFVVEYKVVPLACEIALISRILKVAGAIDLVAEITVKGETYRVIIDYKSNHQAAIPSTNAYQLLMYKMMWEENYPGFAIDKVYNWHPKDFRTEKPTFTFTDLTDKANLTILKNTVENYHLKEHTPAKKMLITGRHKFGEEPARVKLFEIEDYIKLFIL